MGKTLYVRGDVLHCSSRSDQWGKFAIRLSCSAVSSSLNISIMLTLPFSPEPLVQLLPLSLCFSLFYTIYFHAMEDGSCLSRKYDLNCRILVLFFGVLTTYFMSLFFCLLLSSGAARASCTWSCHGRRRTSTSWARTAPLLIACLRSSISTPAASCPLRVLNTCPCSTL